jgi:hypothetical protein
MSVSRLGGSAACLVVLWACAACHSWQPSAIALVAEERPSTVRVTLADGRVATIANPTVVADSIVGVGEGGRGAVAAADVRVVEVNRLSLTRTTSLVVVHVSAAVTFLAYIVHWLPHYRGL